jgi:hypothetical protein
MNDPQAKRRWIFEVEDYDDDSVFIDADGLAVDQDDATPFIGTNEEAEVEGDRRTELLEVRYDALCAKITRHSRGKVEA